MSKKLRDILKAGEILIIGFLAFGRVLQLFTYAFSTTFQLILAAKLNIEILLNIEIFV